VSSETTSQAISQPFFRYQVDHCWICLQAGVRVGTGSAHPSPSFYPFLTYCVLLLLPYVTLWPWPLTFWSWTFIVYRLWRYQIMYRIWANSDNRRLSYSYLKGWKWENLGAVRHFRFNRRWS